MHTLIEGDGRMKYHTDLRLLFEALGDCQRSLNWLITELELNCYPPELEYLGCRDGPRWVSEAELTEIVRSHDLQFVWAVLSGFRPGVVISLADLSPYPFADGNPDLWRPGVGIQHPLAEIEIVCFDSSSTLVLARDPEVAARLRHFFPEAQDLETHNRSRASRS